MSIITEPNINGVKQKHLIIKGKEKPMWLLNVLLFLFLLSVTIFVLYIWDKSLFPIQSNWIPEIAFFSSFILYSKFYRRSIHVLPKTSQFRNTLEFGPFKTGEWKTIHNYEYVSIFFQPGNTEEPFKVNIFDNQNKHLTLYKHADYKRAYLMAIDLSNQLSVDLLDATKPHDYQWVDKVKSLEQKKLVYQDA